MKENKELILEISYKCNANCIHCSSINCEGKLGLKDISKIVNLDEINVVRLSGGEPTILPNLQDYVKFFKDRDIKVILQTNGWTDNFVSRDIDEIWISLYGNEDFHDFITRPEEYRSSYYFNVINTIKVLSKRGYNLKIQSCIFSETQYWSLLWLLKNKLAEQDLSLRLFRLLNHGRCNFAYSLEKQLEIINDNIKMYNNIEITCSLDKDKCNYENKLVLKPDGSLFNCASYKHKSGLCKR